MFFYVFATPYLYGNSHKHTDWTDKAINILAALILWGLIVFLIFLMLGINLTLTWLVAGIIGFFVVAGLSNRANKKRYNEGSENTDQIRQAAHGNAGTETA